MLNHELLNLEEYHYLAHIALSCIQEEEIKCGRDIQGHTGTYRERQGRTGTERDRQTQAGISRDKQGPEWAVPACSCLSLFVSVLSLLVPALSLALTGVIGNLCNQSESPLICISCALWVFLSMYHSLENPVSCNT